MPYAESAALPFERASKLGHLSVINDPFVQELLEEFEQTGGNAPGQAALEGDVVEAPDAEPLDFVVAVDGSVSDIPNTLAKHKMLSYVKVAALGLSLKQLRRVERPIVNPDVVSEMLEKGADTFSTVLPLSNVAIPGRSIFESIRATLLATFKHLFEGAVYDTLRYLISREWLPAYTMTAHFGCPFCERDVPLPRSQSEFPCPNCSRELTIVDYLELTALLSEEGNDSRVATDLMVILENLLLLHYLRSVVERGYASRTLLLKDGPLMLAHQYSRLVDPIREYLAYLVASGIPVHLAGVEKQQAFVIHVPELQPLLEPGQVFVPSNDYILTYIKSGGGADTLYGEKVLYGAKLYFRVDPRNMLVLNMPYGVYHTDVKASEFYGFDRTLATLRQLVSRQFQNALLPIHAINQIVSLSVYPSNKILESFAEAALADG